MNVRQAFIVLAFSALLSSGCTTRPLETEGFDLAGYNAISLALSLKSTGDVPAVQTKMTATITQDGAGFRGIEQIYVVPFQTESAVPVGGGSTRLGDSNVQIHNPTIGQNGLVANNNSHLYDIVRVPLKTNRVLAYGKAFDSGSVATREGKHKNGVLTPSGLDNPSASADISFSLEPVLETADLTAVSQTTDNLVAALNGVIEVLQSYEDADIRAFLDVFTFQNQIVSCSYYTLYRMEQNILGALSEYRAPIRRPSTQ